MIEVPTPVVDEVLRLGFEVDPTLTLGELRHGPRDPLIRFERGVVWRASREVDGAATTRIAPAAGGWRLTGWGPGARTAAAAVPQLLGSRDDPDALTLPAGQLRDLAARLAGMRFGRTAAIWPSLLAAVCGQKVTSVQAQRAYLGIIARFGEEAPGPGGLHLPPRPEDVAALPYYALHGVGLEQRRATTLIGAAARIDWLQEAVTMSPAMAMARLQALPGLGPWTAAEVARPALGDADAVSVGDYHVPDLVCWALAGEPRGNDARMLELLEPYRGQRARVVRILERSGVRAPRFGPRLRARRIEQM